jgi:hypothetical protein
MMLKRPCARCLIGNAYKSFFFHLGAMPYTFASKREANPTNIEKFMERGRNLWKDIYTPHDVKLANKLASYHPDFICARMHRLGVISFHTH